jgi:hydroxypyruvate isomerase
MLFTEVDFMDRFERAARAGFKAVEYMFPYAYNPEQLKEKLEQNGLQQVLFNLPAGNWEKGERGIAVLPDRVEEFRKGVETAIEYATKLNCRRVNCLVGLTPADTETTAVRKCLVANLRSAAEALGKEGIALLVEALNTRDIPGSYLTHTSQVVSLLDEVAHPNLFIQYDVYHMQIMEGDLTKTIRDTIGRIGHIQIADTPGRNEPGTGEINYTNLFRFIDEAGFNGFIGCEYRPAGKTEDGLGWFDKYR